MAEIRYVNVHCLAAYQSAGEFGQGRENTFNYECIIPSYIMRKIILLLWLYYTILSGHRKKRIFFLQQGGLLEAINNSMNDIKL